ncbi:MAG: glycosyltransferase [Lachnospiraceae bacterium]|nr:glycosyltransferase [Lachnospiraceae bacterium]
MAKKKRVASDKRIRVLHVAEAAGGVDRYLKTLFKYIDRTKIETFFICSQNYCVDEYIKIADHVEQIQMAHDISVKKDLESIKNLRRLIKEYSPDIIYAHSSKAGALARMADMWIPNVVLYNPHGWAFNMRCGEKKKLLYRLVERMQAPFTDKIVCISEAEKNTALQSHICAEKKMQVIYNGIDLEEGECDKKLTRSDIGIPDEAFVIGMVGRIAEQKAPDIFVKMSSMIKEKIPEAFFIIVGDGTGQNQDEKNKVVTMIEESGLKDSFIITGWVESPLQYIRLFNVGVLLSRWEGFGLVIPEYMICNVPVVATNVDAIPNIIEDGVNGLLVSADDASAAADSVMRIYHDVLLCKKLTANGKRIVERKFDGKRLGRETTQLFLDCICNRG